MSTLFSRESKAGGPPAFLFGVDRNQLIRSSASAFWKRQKDTHAEKYMRARKMDILYIRFDFHVLAPFERLV